MSEPVYAMAPKRRGPVPAASCCVYLISGGEKLTKVGMSKDPQKRLGSLRTANAEKMALEHEWRVQSRDQAAALESRIHAVFRWARVRREWFAAEPRWIVGVTDHLLRGEVEKAERISECLRISEAHMAHHDQLNKRWKATNPRRKAERDELRQVLDEALDAHIAAYVEALSAGLPPDEWDRELFALHPPSTNTTERVRLTRGE